MSDNRPCEQCGKTEDEIGIEHEVYDEDGVEELLCIVCISVRNKK